MFKATMVMGAQLAFWGACVALGYYGMRHAFICVECAEK